jgi:zinc transporter
MGFMGAQLLPDDAQSLLWAYHFGQHDVVAEIDAAEASLVLSDSNRHGFVWVHLNLAHNGAERWLRAHGALPEAFFDVLLSPTRTTRFERDEDLLMGVLNDVSFDFAYEPTDIATLWVAVAPGMLVSARRQPLRSVDRLRGAVRSGDAFRSSVDLLAHLMRDQADVLIEVVRSVSQRVDSIEDSLLAGRLKTKRADLGAMRRLLVRLQRLLAPEPGSLFRLLQYPPAWIEAIDVQELRQSTEEFSVAMRDISGLQERIKLLQEEIAAQVAESNNRSLFVLTMVTVLALPINLTAGLFGMNVGGIPFGESRHGFMVVGLLVIAFTALVAWILLRDRDEG